jgi:hypothetical protein
MARLRIRIELSSGGIGVPLRKLASVLVESQKFLNLLTEDVRADKQNGEWLGFDFDRENLNYTAEYVGPITNSQVEAFNAAFSGTTSLRRDTIGQFLRITDSIGDDEVIGFGLYRGEGDTEPGEWRCLSRRDALRIADEVKVLLGAGQAPYLPEVGDRALGARIFGDRRDRHTGETSALEKVRSVESGIVTRMQRLESQVEQHSGLIQDLRTQSNATESSVLGLLSTFESFCEQATRKIEQIAVPPVPAIAAEAPVPLPGSRKPWIFAAAGILVAALVGGAWLWLSPPQVVKAKQETPMPNVAKENPPKESLPKASLPKENAPPVVQAASAPEPKLAETPAMEVELGATDPTWVSMRDGEGTNLLAQLLVPGTPRTVTVAKSAILRVGNAGGLVVHLNGRPIGSIGPSGQVREIEFKNGTFSVVP